MTDFDPYKPVANVTAETDPTPTPLPRLAAIGSVRFIVLSILFGLGGFAGYIALAITLERQPWGDEPMLSYGQQAFLISLPLCTMIAASTGGALAFAFVRKRAICVVLLFVIALVGWMVTRSLWNAQIAQYGRDASEVVLYYPPTGYAAATASIGLFLLIYMIVRRAKDGEPSIAREIAGDRFGNG